MIADPDIFCTRPFEWCEIQPDGAVFLCCPAWLKRPIGNLLQQDADELWNSAVALEIRKSVLNGSYHNCSRARCPRLNGSNGAAIEPGSDRARADLRAGRSRLEQLPARLNLCFDTSCNLACPSCRPQLQVTAGAARLQAETLARRISAQLLPGAQELTLSGYGDPFASPVYSAFLQQVNPCSAPQLRRLRLHTNGLLFDAEHWQSLPALHPLLAAVEVSVDAGSAATYAENRGGDYALLQRNLRFIAGLGVPLRLSMVVQQNNYREIALLHRQARTLGAGLYLARLINWGSFSRAEYRRRDVVDPGHPEHLRLCDILQSLAAEPDFDPGNLTQLLSS